MKLLGVAAALVQRDEAFIREFRVIRVFRGSLFGHDQNDPRRTRKTLITRNGKV